MIMDQELVLRQKNTFFEMFYTGTHKIVDSRRSLGLGLSLCRSIIEAHEGTSG